MVPPSRISRIQEKYSRIISLGEYLRIQAKIRQNDIVIIVSFLENEFSSI